MNKIRMYLLLRVIFLGSLIMLQCFAEAPEEQRVRNPFLNKVIETYGSIYENSETIEAMIEYLDTIRPDDSGSDVGVGNQINFSLQNQLGVHLDLLRTTSSPDCRRHINKRNFIEFWSQGLHTKAIQNKQEKSLGYQNFMNGFSLGIDKYLNDAIFGVSLNYIKTQIKHTTQKNNIRDHQVLVHTASGSLYGSKYFKKLYIDVMATYSQSIQNSIRMKSVAELKANYNSSYMGFKITVGRELSAFIIKIEPTVNIRSNLVFVDAYNAIPVTDQITNKEFGEIHQGVKQLRVDVGAGIKISQPWVFSNGVLIPKFAMTTYKNLVNNSKEKKIVFATDNYWVKSSPKIYNQFEALVGADLNMKSFILSVGYIRRFNKDFVSNDFYGRLHYDF